MQKGCVVLNLKQNMPTCEDAMISLKFEINNLIGNEGCIYIIHGYGSSGKGGIIRIKVRKWLEHILKKGKIKSIIYGEDFNIFNREALELKFKYKELNDLMNSHNLGVTVVEL